MKDGIQEGLSWRTYVVTNCLHHRSQNFTLNFTPVLHGLPSGEKESSRQNVKDILASLQNELKKESPPLLAYCLSWRELDRGHKCDPMTYLYNNQLKWDVKSGPELFRVSPTILMRVFYNHRWQSVTMTKKQCPSFSVSIPPGSHGSCLLNIQGCFQELMQWILVKAFWGKQSIA